LWLQQIEQNLWNIKWPRICSTCKHFPVLSSFMTYHRVCTYINTMDALVEQELLTLPVHLSSPPVLCGVRVTRSLISYVCFVDRCLSLCTFSFDHCVVCSSSIYRFLLPPLVSSNCSSYLHHFANIILRNNTSIIVPVVLVLFKHL